jgi:hypothetical protein
MGGNPEGLVGVRNKTHTNPDNSEMLIKPIESEQYPYVVAYVLRSLRRERVAMLPNNP